MLGVAIDKVRLRNIESFEQIGDEVCITYTDGSQDKFDLPGLTADSIMTDADGNVIITLSDGTSFTVPAGAAGRGIMLVERMGNFVVITYDDGTQDSLPLRDGNPGLPGPSAAFRWDTHVAAILMKTMSRKDLVAGPLASIAPQDFPPSFSQTGLRFSVPARKLSSSTRPQPHQMKIMGSILIKRWAIPVAVLASEIL